MPDDFFPAKSASVKPFVHEDERTVSLHFDMSETQSRMRRDDPTALELDYTRAMMGFLVIAPEPRSMLMIGLGGGSIAKYCHKHFPAADITVVESNRHVIALREVFFVPPDGRRFRVAHADGAAFVAASKRSYDVVLVDAFTHAGQPAGLCTPDFYAQCRALLTPDGALAVNLHSQGPDDTLLSERIALVFGAAGATFQVDVGSNRIVFGASSAAACHPVRLKEHWAALAPAHQRTLAVIAGHLARRFDTTEPAPRSRR